MTERHSLILTLYLEGENREERQVELFSFWMNLFDSLFSKNELPKSQCLNLLEWDFYNKNTSKKDFGVVAHVFLRIISRILLIAFSFFKNFSGKIPGGVNRGNFFDKVVLFFCKTILRSSSVEFCPKTKEIFFYKIKLLHKIDQHYIKALELVIPDIFFSSLKQSSNYIPKVFNGSSISLLSYPWVYLILFKNVRIINIAHGGCYDELLIHRSQDFEIRISNDYFGFGLSDKNIEQNRFKEEVYKAEKITSVTIVGMRNDMTSTMKWIHPDLDTITLDLKNNRELLFEKVSRQFSLLCRPDRRSKGSSLLDKYSVKNNYSYSGTLFLFDRPCTTFIYKCIYCQLPFILYFNKDWLCFFTKNYIDFLFFLQEKGVLFFWGDEDIMIEKIYNTINHQSLDKSIFSDIKKYLQ
jgi:hypothetical protein